jgi:hypothetical protein
MPGGRADLPDHQRIGGDPVAVQHRQRAVVPHNPQRQHVTVKRQRAVKVTNLEIDTKSPDSCDALPVIICSFPAM